MYSRYKEIISISSATTENLRKYIKISCPIDTISNGIDVERYSAAVPVERKNIGCKNDTFLLMMVAGFRYQKDQDTIIRALTLLPKNVQLCLVGDGDRRVECKELVKRLNLEERVVFTGVRSDIPNVLKAADVVVMSSHLEGFGLAAVEGMPVMLWD
jgi:glycosyltransferase involved in cell wall biosynthesis